MAAIRAEHAEQDRVLLGQQTALTNIVRSIQDARTLGKQEQDAADDAGTPPDADAEPAAGDDVEMGSPGAEETGEIREDRASPAAAAEAAHEKDAHEQDGDDARD